MASERDLELLDDYISNRLKGAEREEFESKLEQDPSLQSELAFQQQIADALRSARTQELKNMLNQIPQSALGPQNRLSSTVIAIGVTIIAALSLFFYLRPDSEATNQSVKPAAQENKATEQEPMEQPVVEPQATNVDEQEKTQQEPVARPKQKKAPVSDPVKEPKLEVFDPTEENEQVENEDPEQHSDNTVASSSSIAVETDNSNKKYTFHYQFREDKVILYGSFEKNLYEILEFFTDNKRTVFLFYKNNYYLLHQSPGKVTPLSPVNDPALLKKLREYRSN